MRTAQIGHPVAEENVPTRHDFRARAGSREVGRAVVASLVHSGEHIPSKREDPSRPSQRREALAAA